ncbi:vWA domain-containing protein [Neomegalonema perideroedes]|uniref:vWA domain-containing protein n=1 Tax=Neomegalonema perideroedes TaxID=217219 RepID=UPI00035E56B4|nr:VWA domain-containing protein [Neomegalonema perideroedes]
MSKSDLKTFIISSPRPLPVIVLADESGSMSEHRKIETLNSALRDMFGGFAQDVNLRAELQIAVIGFGGDGARLHQGLIPAKSFAEAGFPDLRASGPTPMGGAFELLLRMLEDPGTIPSRAYRPVVALVSDGFPTDEWEAPLKALEASERAQKATRIAMAIGSDADEAMLKRFINDPETPLFQARNARDVHRFFRAVTLSVSTRTASRNPDEASRFSPPSGDGDGRDLDLDFT